MRVTVTLALEIPEERVSVKSIDEVIGAAMPRFASEAWQKFVWAVEERARRQHRAGELEVKSHEWRTLWTSAGRVRFRRRRFISEAIVDPPAVLARPNQPCMVQNGHVLGNRRGGQPQELNNLADAQLSAFQRHEGTQAVLVR